MRCDGRSESLNITWRKHDGSWNVRREKKRGITVISRFLAHEHRTFFSSRSKNFVLLRIGLLQCL
jgi:hypothetical protein